MKVSRVFDFSLSLFRLRRYTQLRDAGEYMCQVNLEPKISRSVFLVVRGEQTCGGGDNDKGALRL